MSATGRGGRGTILSRASDSTTTKLKKSHGEDAGDSTVGLAQKMYQLKKQIQTERVMSVKEKLEHNRNKVESYVSRIYSAILIGSEPNGRSSKLLDSRIKHPPCKFSGFSKGFGDKDHGNDGEELLSSSIELPKAHKIDPYTTWIWLDRNQRMAEDQSVVGRRQIYYDKEHGSEALVYSDTDDEMTEPEEVKRAFSGGEDRILLMAFQEHGTGKEVVKVVSQFIGATTSEIQERYITIKERDCVKLKSKGSGESGSDRHLSLDKSLSAALDSFDNLFCRRCLIFDCRLHGCSQPLIYPSEKQVHGSEHDERKKPCSDQCYLRLNGVENMLDAPDSDALHGEHIPSSEEESISASLLNAEQPSCGGTDIKHDERQTPGKAVSVIPETIHSSEVITRSLGLDTDMMTTHNEDTGKRKAVKYTDKVSHEKNIVPADLQGSSKKQKGQDVLHIVIGTGLPFQVQDYITSYEHGNSDAGLPSKKELEIRNDESTIHTSKELVCFGSPCDETMDNVKEEPIDVREVIKQPSNSIGGKVEGQCSSSSEWKTIEKELYMKGLEIFGRNSCLIARNLLSGFRTCLEVSIFMHDAEGSMSNRSTAGPCSFMEDNGKADTDQSEQEIRTKSRSFRRRGKARRLKYSWKSAGHPSAWKRIADGKNDSRKQYIPCGCQSTCGKQCACLQNGTCCEKYCGCSKSCKNRFRGCHCAKSQCRSRQCPCFAADRECDPDVCRNCWVSCGDSSLGQPPKQGDSQCGNMRLLLRQQQRILLGKSDVAGWGAFLKNPVNKNDYLGEYTGELISHEEADRRGKIYDRADSSFLFDLNNQWVLDAYRKGDKLKFANHSKKPNCHAKVMLVTGDHRVGIFAKEHIDAGEEIFYDYCYPPEAEIPWAQADGSKRDDSSVSQVRAKKHQSH